MATYSAVSASEKDADSPINVGLIDKLDQNPHAIAEGAAGAPKIQSAALDSDVVTADKVADDAITGDHLQSPVAGSTYTICRALGGTFSTSETSYTGTDSKGCIDDRCISLICLVAGSIRVQFTQDVPNLGSHTSYIRVVKNGSTVQEWSRSSDDPATRSVNVTVAVGDCVQVQNRAAEGSSYLSDVLIQSDNPSMAVA